MAVLSAKDIRSGYGEIEVLHGVSIEINRGEIVAIIGPNGSGKSTLMKTVAGHLNPSEGKVRLLGDEITGLEPDQIVRRGMCYVPQEDNIFPSLTVSENLEMGAFTRTDNYEDSTSEVYSIFPVLKEKSSQKTANLSGGQQQMVAIGLALMMDPDILLLDEPTAGLAPNLADMILEKVHAINDAGVSILMVEQNAKEALSMANRGYVLAMGENQYEDTGEALLNNEEVGKLYLGA
ncbi:MAG: ABC transporter ATP-binding protein [Candidatus Bipolaricaulia bacterium]